LKPRDLLLVLAHDGHRLGLPLFILRHLVKRKTGGYIRFAVPTVRAVATGRDDVWGEGFRGGVPAYYRDVERRSLSLRSLAV